MNIIRGIIGLLVLFGVGFIFSSNRKHIRYKQIAIMIVCQLVITYLSLYTSAGVSVLTKISLFFAWLTDQAMSGVNFVFGGMKLTNNFMFFLNVLMPIIFISALVGILNYIRVLPLFIRGVGGLLNKITGMGEVESYFSISTMVLGQAEVWLTIKDQVGKLSNVQLYTLGASAMSGVSASLLASYMSMVEGKFVVVAVCLNIFSALIISSIINPYDPRAKGNLVGKEIVQSAIEKEPFFQMLGEWIIAGFHLAVTICAILIGFVALVTFLNSTFSYLFHISFTKLLGYGFAPFAYAIGIPAKDITKIGTVMATKLLTNEFVAMGELKQFSQQLSAKSIAMISTYLISFANFGSVGVVAGAVKSINQPQGNQLARYSLKLLLGATMASLLTATIVGMFY